MPHWGDRMDRLEQAVDRQTEVRLLREHMNRAVGRSAFLYYKAKYEQALRELLVELHYRRDQLDWVTRQDGAAGGGMSWFSVPSPWVDQLARQQREQAPAFLEQLYRQQQFGLARAQFEAARAAPRPSPPPQPPQYAQGMARGYWRGGAHGKHPGYRTLAR